MMRTKAKIIRAVGLSEYEGMPIVKTPIVPQLKGYRTRLALVQGKVWFRVPEFIYRHDQSSRDRGSYGWLVGRSSEHALQMKFFPDAQYGSRESIAAAKRGLAAAQDYLAAHLPYDESKYSTTCEVNLDPERYHKRGAHRLVKQQAKGCRFPQYYFEITGVNGYPLKRIYIGSSRNITQARIDEKVSLGKRFRSKIEKLSAKGYFDDAILGLVFNMVQVYVFLALMAKVTGLKAGVAYHKLVNCHIYENQIALMKEQLEREPFKSPQLHINPDIKTMEDVLTWVSKDDFHVTGYEHHPAIAYPFSV